MAATCTNCGDDLFLGEQVCARCRTPVPQEHRTDEPRTTSAGPPRPEGLNLLVGKMQADAESFRDDDRWQVEQGYGDEGLVMSRSVDVSHMVRPERDRDGKVVVDLKYALVGAVVVGVLAGLVYWYIASTVTTLPGS